MSLPIYLQAGIALLCLSFAWRGFRKGYEWDGPIGGILLGVLYFGVGGWLASVIEWWARHYEEIKEIDLIGDNAFDWRRAANDPEGLLFFYPGLLLVAGAVVYATRRLLAAQSKWRRENRP